MIRRSFLKTVGTAIAGMMLPFAVATAQVPRRVGREVAEELGVPEITEEAIVKLFKDGLTETQSKAWNEAYAGSWRRSPDRYRLVDDELSEIYDEPGPGEGPDGHDLPYGEA